MNLNIQIHLKLGFFFYVFYINNNTYMALCLIKTSVAP